MTLDEVENEIYWHYRNTTEDVMRIVGRDNYLRNPVYIHEVGRLGELWALFDILVQEEAA